jgi:hypothetical protein
MHLHLALWLAAISRDTALYMTRISTEVMFVPCTNLGFRRLAFH